jgi:2-iminobutanoate/2-iminopropanoate deaminase
MSKTVVTTSKAPAAIGAYSQAVSANGFVFCSGQVALGPGGEDLVGDSVAEQTVRCLDNLAAILEGARSSLVHVVKVVAYLTDMGDFQEFNEAYGGYFAADPPARVTVGVAALPKGARVEIECIALG